MAMGNNNPIGSNFCSNYGCSSLKYFDTNSSSGIGNHFGDNYGLAALYSINIHNINFAANAADSFCSNNGCESLKYILVNTITHNVIGEISVNGLDIYSSML